MAEPGFPTIYPTSPSTPPKLNPTKSNQIKPQRCNHRPPLTSVSPSRLLRLPQPTLSRPFRSSLGSFPFPTRPSPIRPNPTKSNHNIAIITRHPILLPDVTTPNLIPPTSLIPFPPRFPTKSGSIKPNQTTKNQRPRPQRQRPAPSRPVLCTAQPGAERSETDSRRLPAGRSEAESTGNWERPFSHRCSMPTASEIFYFAGESFKPSAPAAI